MESSAGPRDKETIRWTSAAGLSGATPEWLKPPEASKEPTRRFANLIMALGGLAVAAPLMLVIAVVVRLTSRGPVLYTQRRVGYDRRADPAGDGAGPHAGPRAGPRADHKRKRDVGGRPFTIYKFRTMYCDEDRGQVWACPGDDRVTPVGRTLRDLHLDELPQLFNVLKGDMNVVGPRPEQPRIFARLAEEVPRYRLRQRVRPGITGWAQVNQRYDRSLDDVRKKVELDLEYIERRSALEDLKIAFQTLPAVFGEDGKGRGW